MNRISATTLEAYRLFLTEDWMDYDRLAAQLGGEREETDAMRRGTSLHQILEVPQKKRAVCFGKDTYTHLGFVWDAAEVDAIASEGINEIKAEYPITPDTILVAKADNIHGLAVTDYKTTTGPFSADKYLASVQWKIYCLAFDAQQFTYRVLEIKDGDIQHIKAEHALTCRPYPGMKEEIATLTADFITFCQEHGFTQAITPRKPA